MIKNNQVFFSPWETIHEGNPQEILERKEKVACRPCSSCRARSTTTCCRRCRRNFARTYRAAGGQCDYRLFENSVHEWVAEPGPQTDKARETAKEFIARQLEAERPPRIGDCRPASSVYGRVLEVRLVPSIHPRL